METQHKRYRCEACQYETKTACNYRRHMTSKMHFNKMSNKIVDYKFTCECKKKCMSKQAFDYHKKVCTFVEGIEIGKLKRIVPSEISSILAKMKPMTMTDFIDCILIRKEGFNEDDLSDDHAIQKVISLFKEEIIAIPVINRPFHDFGEYEGAPVVHFFTEDGWQRDTLFNIMITNMNKDNSGTPYKMNKFMYYIQVFYSNRLYFFRKNFLTGTKYHETIVRTENSHNKLFLLQELLKMVKYDDYRVKSNIGFVDEKELGQYEDSIDDIVELERFV